MDDGTVRVASQSVVTVGSQVRIRDEFGEDTFRIVNAEVSDAGRHWISEDTPMARALIGHKPGDVVRVLAPFGHRYVRVLAVEVISEP
jgi:transcription elongation factor GreB